MAKHIKIVDSPLTDQIEIVVRFSEVDMMRVAWHGSYVAYLEDGREHFGIRYAGIGYDDYFRTGYVAPVVNMNIDYKGSLRTGEHAIVETRYVPAAGAKLILQYIVYRKDDMAIMAVAETTQVFTTADGEMQYAEPDFFVEWKKRWIDQTK